MFTEGYTLEEVASFLTIVSRGWRLASPPGGRELQPVTNWMKFWEVAKRESLRKKKKRLVNEAYICDPIETCYENLILFCKRFV